MVVEASRALALLDADRLEELARACQALNREHKLGRANADRAEVARQSREAAREMALFARVLDATRANLAVMNRLRALREGTVEYADAGPRRSHWALTEGGDGND